MSFVSYMASLAPVWWSRLSSAASLADASGNGRHGAWTGTVTLQPGAVFKDDDQAVSLASGYGRVTDAAWMDTPHATFGALFLTGSDPGVFVSRWGASGAAYMAIDVTGGTTARVYANISGTTRTVSATLPKTVFDSKWHMIVGTYDGATLRLFIDGAEVASGAFAGSLPNVTADLVIGSRQDNFTVSSNRFTGFMDEAFVLDYAMTPTQVADLWAAADIGASQDGSWSWWTRPRAVAFNGRTYVGVVGSGGGIAVQEYADVTRAPLKQHALYVGEVDDHNSPALIIEAGKAPIVMWQRHAANNLLYWVKGTVPIESGFGTFGAVQSLDIGGGASYSAVHVLDGVIYVVMRKGANAWHLVKSTDWGATFTNVGQIVAHAAQMYLASRLVGNRIRMAASAHPRETGGQSIYYAELDPVTGTLYNRAGASIGTVGGTQPVMTAWEEAAAPPAGYKTWVYDVSPGPGREIVWAYMDSSDTPTITMNRYTTDASGAWVTRNIVSPGAPFGAGAAPDMGGNYLGGVQFRSAGDVVLAREASGTWHVEEWSTSDHGVSWTSVEYASSSTRKLARPWPVSQRDATPTAAVAYNDLSTFTGYTTWSGKTVVAGTFTPPPPEPTGPTVLWWDDVDGQPADVIGWWDGAASQGATVLGAWDGAAVQPLA